MKKQFYIDDVELLVQHLTQAPIAAITLTIEDNPSVPDDYSDKMREEMTPETFRNTVEGKFVPTQKGDMDRDKEGKIAQNTEITPPNNTKNDIIYQKITSWQPVNRKKSRGKYNIRQEGIETGRGSIY